MSTSHLPAQLIEIVSGTGVFLDPVYTLKGVRGMLEEMRRTPERFAGKRILYIHTGIAEYCHCWESVIHVLLLLLLLLLLYSTNTEGQPGQPGSLNTELVINTNAYIVIR